MEKIDKDKRKIYRSMVEIEKDFFPESHKNRFINDENNNPGVFGTKLAMEFLESIKKKLDASLPASK